MAQLTLPTFFSDHMVLQRGSPVRVWGDDAPGSTVVVSLDGREVGRTTADATGRFRVDVPAIESVGPHTLTVAGSTTSHLKDVLVGEVWICSGQSNMEWSVSQSDRPDEEIADAVNWPTIRLLTIPNTRATAPQRDANATWQTMSPESIRNFSAVAYSFGRKLSKELDGVPIGLIDSSWGGTHAEAWVPKGDLLKLPGMDAFLAADQSGYAKAWSEFAPRFEAWLDRTGRGWNERSADSRDWVRPEFDDSSWTDIRVPGMFQDQGYPFNAVVWYRRTIDLTLDQPGSNWTLELGGIDDFDQTYLNGQLVGTTDARTISFWSTPRVYNIPPGVLRAGKNTIAVRVLDHGGQGGFTGPPGVIRLTDGSKTVPLAGTWKFAVERQLKITSDEVAPAMPATGDIMATELYNAMIHPLVPMSIRGAIWYQGESNVGRWQQYQELMNTLITSWRRVFENPDFPFLVVQLAGFMTDSGEPAFDSAWARLREAQRYLTNTLPNTALAVAIDIGDPLDIHPRNKQDVGTRLARQALALTYGKSIVKSGPTPKSIARQDDGSVKLVFDNVAQGLRLAEPSGFAVGDASGNFAWAKALLQGTDTLVLESDTIKAVTIVRYAWGNSPNHGLTNSEGLPGVPFEQKIQ